MTISIGGGAGSVSASGPGLGIDVWGSQANPGAVTDWGPIINAMLPNPAHGTRLRFGAHDYPFSTQINVRDSAAVIFEGETGVVWTASSGTLHGGARLLWTGGAGSGTAIRAGGADSFMLRDLSIMYQNLAYNGDLITFGYGVTSRPSSYCMIEHCGIGPAGDRSASQAARSLVSFDGAVSPKISDSVLMGAQSCIRGFENAASTISNDVIVQGCMFDGFSLAAIMNVGYLWHIDSCTFESEGIASPGNCIDSDFTSPQTSIFTLVDAWTWDWSNDAAMVLKQRVNNPWQVTVIGGWSGGKNSGKYFDFQGPGTVSIRSHIFNGAATCTPIDLGPAATAKKQRVLIQDCDWGGVGVQVPVINVVGHDQVTIERNGTGQNSTAGLQLDTLTGYQRVGVLGAGPSIAIHAGYAAPSGFLQEIAGTDMAGIIRLSPSSPGAPAGLAVDVTFGTPMTPAGRTSGRRPLLSVQLTPTTTADSNQGPAAVAAGAYSLVPNASDAAVAATGFTIGFANAIPTGAVVAFAYRVIQL